MTDNYCVYKHTSPDGKVYIGVTCQKPETRWMGGFGYASNTHFFVDIVKYGWDNFEHEILLSGLDKMDALHIEQELIAAYRSNWPDKGYNVAVKQSKPRIVKTRDDPHGEIAAPHTPPSEVTRIQVGSPSKRVCCVELNEIYPSVKAAARALVVQPKSLRQAIQTGRRCHGYHWRYADPEEVIENAG